MIFFNSTSCIIQSGFLKEGQTTCDIQFTSSGLSDAPLTFCHSFPKTLSLIPPPRRREPGGHPFSLRPQSYPIGQRKPCSTPLKRMQKSFYCQDGVLSVLGKIAHTHKKFCIHVHVHKRINCSSFSLLNWEIHILCSYFMVHRYSSNFKKRLFELQLLYLNHGHMGPFFSFCFLILLWKREKPTPLCRSGFLTLSPLPLQIVLVSDLKKFISKSEEVHNKLYYLNNWIGVKSIFYRFL